MWRPVVIHDSLIASQEYSRCSLNFSRTLVLSHISSKIKWMICYWYLQKNIHKVGGKGYTSHIFLIGMSLTASSCQEPLLKRLDNADYIPFLWHPHHNSCFWPQHSWKLAKRAYYRGPCIWEYMTTSCSGSFWTPHCLNFHGKILFYYVQGMSWQFL